jgi:hypothetical protein
MFIEFESIEGSTLEQVKAKLKQKSVSFGAITIQEAIQHLNHNGVYLFALKENDNWTPLYVGKSSSRVFFERFAGHFDTRLVGSFNNMIKTLRGNSSDDLQLIAEKFMLNGTVVTIRVKINEDIIKYKNECRKLENILLSSFYDDVINKRKKKLNFDDDIVLSDIMKKLF